MSAVRRDQAYGDPRESVLGRLTGVIYWYLVVTGLVVLTSLPTLAALVLHNSRRLLQDVRDRFIA